MVFGRAGSRLDLEAGPCSFFVHEHPRAAPGNAMSLSLREFSAAGYRSLKQITYPVSRLDVFVGANGVGKSNPYRALELMQGAAANTLGHGLAREGLDLALWAGSRRQGSPARIRLSASLSEADRLEPAYRYE